ncbi:hypothetical protein [Sulfurirhabdus autotrophica]|uniref:Uncharacterized protein n=1 Tax=Sulfurirhabdus autotrophica TaxID=1706046 RepID=A0A4R3XV45_9PROT|nr:hypothetical protein [Sulfurirhabdus autotrophica]TCV81254.1 hypothetical protein EDC63_1241 [Sulfurirhabdus autotrophica]
MSVRDAFRWMTKLNAKNRLILSAGIAVLIYFALPVSSVRLNRESSRQDPIWAGFRKQNILVPI